MSPADPPNAIQCRRQAIILPDTEINSNVVASGGDFSRPAAECDNDAVLNGVLNQRLKRWARYIDCEKVRWQHVHVNFQAIMKGDIIRSPRCTDELRKARSAKGDLVLPPFEGHAQQVAEADWQMTRSIDIKHHHQVSRGVKTVEQKVRM